MNIGVRNVCWVIGLFLGLTSCGTRDIALLRSVEDGDTNSDTTSDSSSTNDSDSGNGTDTTVLACGLNDSTVRVTSFITTVDVNANELESELMPIAISPIPSGGSRVAWMGTDAMVHVTTLNAVDEPVGNDILIEAYDFQDLLATDDGGVLLLTRDAEGGGTLNCGDPANLCNPPGTDAPCYDMYLVRFSMDGEQWAAKLTETSADQPPYSTGYLHYIWWYYAHHGRIASNGDTFAAYYGTALSMSSGTCIDIAQGDRMQVVDGEGNLTDDGFRFGCSPSGYERVVWNANAHTYVAVCKTDVYGIGWAIAFTNDQSVIQEANNWYTNLSDVVVVSDGYWIAASMWREGQPEDGPGMADVHLYHFGSGQPDVDVMVPAEATDNVRAPHLAQYGDARLLLGYEVGPDAGEMAEGTTRTLYLQLHDLTTGASINDPYEVSNVVGNRYQAFRPFPDGSVAYPAPGDTTSTIKILRVLPCGK